MTKLSELIDKHLIDEAREWWRLWSVRLIASALMVDAMTLGPVMALLPASMRETNQLLFDVLQMVLVAAALVARMIKQKKVKPDVQNPTA